MVVPVATAQQITRGFRATMLAAVGLGLLVSGGGVWLSTAIDTGPGATVVLLAIAGFFAVTVGASAVRTARGARARSAPPAAPSAPLDRAGEARAGA